ncbi:MAG: NAD(+)/NADH kinase [Dehalococcoidia bacterium]
MDKKTFIGFIFNESIPKSEELVNQLKSLLSNDYCIWTSPGDEINIKSTVLSDTKIVVTAGGDGTILKASRICSRYGIPILGINLGRVGFMTELRPEEASEQIFTYFNRNSIKFDSRLMLQCEIFDNSKSKPIQIIDALNDVVISRGSDPKLLDIKTKIDSADMHSYRADGLIISSPTGTTGYSLAAGGPIIAPDSQVMLLQPLAAHMNFSKSLVIAEKSIIEISLISKQPASLIIDGIKETNFSNNHLIRITKSPNTTVFLRKDSMNNFYATLTNKLLS